MCTSPQFEAGYDLYLSCHQAQMPLTVEEYKSLTEEEQKGYDAAVLDRADAESDTKNEAM